MGCSVRDLAETIHPHPTLSETLGAAAEVYLGMATDLYRPKEQDRRMKDEDDRRKTVSRRSSVHPCASRASRVLSRAAVGPAAPWRGRRFCTSVSSTPKVASCRWMVNCNACSIRLAV